MVSIQTGNFRSCGYFNFVLTLGSVKFNYYYKDMKYVTYDQFVKVCDRHGVPQVHSQRVFDDMVKRHGESHRRYHTLDHVEAMLAFKHDIIPQDDELEMAIIFHDVIYDPHSKENERNSADYFLQCFDGVIWGEFSSEVERLIIATDHRNARRGTNREDLLIDIDLSIFSAEADEYDAYRHGIREEYKHVSDEQFKKGRARVLNSFLEKPIYGTRYFRPKEDLARENLNRELALL